MLSIRMLGLLRLMLLFSDSRSDCPLTLHPPVIIKEYDEPITVNCSYISRDHEGIYWQTGNVSNDKTYISYKVLSLQKLEWNTEVQCRMKVTETDECSKDLDITLYKRPDHVTVYTLNDTNPVEGKLYVLQCDINDVAPIQNLTVTWYRNNEFITKHPFNKTTKTPDSESSLLTLNVSREDNGAEFTCEARLYLGPEGPQPPVVSNDKLTLYVHYPPEFKNKMEVIFIVVNKSSDISLNCEAEGNPPPQYNWTEHGVNLADGTESLNIIQVNESTSYLCTAKNYLRSIVKKFNVIVNEPATTPAPDVTTHPQAFVPKDCPLTITPPEIVVRYGDPVSVNCSATSTDVIGISWEGEGTKNVSDVTWTAAKLEDWNMNPACFATLKDNSQCEKIPNITLYKTPDIVSVSALNLSVPMVHGTEFQLTCNIINVAPVNSLRVKWRKNNETVKTDIFNDTSVAPKNVSSILKMMPKEADKGANFTCVAELHLGGNGPHTVPSEISEPYIAVVNCPVTITPAELVVRYGDKASANCSTSVSDVAGMGWESTSGGVAFRNASTVHWVVKKLEVWEIQPSCFLVLKNKEQCHKKLNITVYKTPDKVSVLDDGPMVEGEEYRLKCHISDVVPADKVKVKWYRNDEYVQDMFSDTHVDPNNNNISAILTITPKRDDNGANFTCVAEMHLGENGPQPIPTETSEPYTADVHYKPLFSSCPRNYAGKEHEFSMNMVPCKADANPPPVVQWYYHETPINASELLTRTHSGKYRAEAVNEVGNSSMSVDVTVEYGPSFSCEGSDEVEENGFFHSKCQPEGIPKPNITWFKDAVPMEFPRHWNRQDSGIYSIVAKNKYGKANYTLHLDVLYIPEFKEGDNSKEMKSGENITLDCYAEGNPSPYVQWNYPLAENVHTTGGQQRSVSVIGATSTNAGVYICIATNKIGSVTRTVTLSMKGETSTVPQYPIILLMSLVIILLVIILMAVICNRKRKHGQYNFLPTADSLPMSTRPNGVHT